MTNRLTRWLRALVRPRVVRFAGVLARLGEEQKRADLCATLGRCGEGVSIKLPLHIEAPAKVSIGRDASLNPFIHIWGHGGVEIGDRTMIASHVAIISLTHDPDSPHMHASLVSGPVRIASDVWIGAHAVIMPGVSIGAHAVVAAGAVVREDVPAYAVVAGVPAAVVRTKNEPDADRPSTHARTLRSVPR